MDMDSKECRYREELIRIFEKANSDFLKNEKSLILDGVSERMGIDKLLILGEIRNK